MEGRRLDAKFAESASLLAQVFMEAKRGARRGQEGAREAVWKDVSAFMDAAAKERRGLSLADLEHFAELMLRQSEQAAEAFP